MPFPSSASKSNFDSDDLGSKATSYSFSPTPSVPASLSPLEIGETLDDIADSNYFFCGNFDVTDVLYSTELFATAQTCYCDKIYYYSKIMLLHSVPKREYCQDIYVGFLDLLSVVHTLYLWHCFYVSFPLLFFNRFDIICRFGIWNNSLW